MYIDLYFPGDVLEEKLVVEPWNRGNEHFKFWLFTAKVLPRKAVSYPPADAPDGALLRGKDVRPTEGERLQCPWENPEPHPCLAACLASRGQVSFMLLDSQCSPCSKDSDFRETL